MGPLREVRYNYWTGIQWEPQRIQIDPPMATGWHIFHVVLTLMSLGAWLPVYVLLYWSAWVDAKHRTERAIEEVNAYNNTLYAAGILKK